LSKNAGAENSDGWPKRFGPDESVPDALRNDEAVSLIEVSEDRASAGGTPTILAHHSEHSPRTWLEIEGVERAELSEAELYAVSNSVTETLNAAGNPLAAVHCHSDNDVTVATGEAAQITPQDIAATMKVLEQLREEFRDDRMIGAARRLNNAHAIVQEHAVSPSSPGSQE